MMPAHPVFESIGTTKMVNVRANRLEQLGFAMLKRTFDIVISAAALIITSPLLLFLAVGVKVSSPGPILFVQERVGYKKKKFKMLKFRSMRVNHESDTRWSRPEQHATPETERASTLPSKSGIMILKNNKNKEICS